MFTVKYITFLDISRSYTCSKCTAADCFYSIFLVIFQHNWSFLTLWKKWKSVASVQSYSRDSCQLNRICKANISVWRSLICELLFSHNVPRVRIVRLSLEQISIYFNHTETRTTETWILSLNIRIIKVRHCRQIVKK